MAGLGFPRREAQGARVDPCSPALMGPSARFVFLNREWNTPARASTQAKTLSGQNPRSPLSVEGDACVLG
jgi:hypothetical protein